MICHRCHQDYADGCGCSDGGDNGLHSLAEELVVTDAEAAEMRRETQFGSRSPLTRSQRGGKLILTLPEGHPWNSH